LNVLVPSIVDPALHRGGAGTVTRALAAMLARPPLGARVEYVCPPSASRKFHRGRQVVSLARSLVSPLPSKALMTHSRRFRRDVRGLLSDNRFDIVVLNGSDLLWLLPEIPRRIPRILISHNIEYQLFLSQIDTYYPKPGLRRTALMRDWRRLRKYEMAGMKAMEDIVFLSEEDATIVSELSAGVRSLVIPPVFGYQPAPGITHSQPRAGIDVGFVGNFDWWPNKEGLRWFLSEVFPKTSSDMRLHLFGEGSRSVAPSHPRILNHGFVENAADVWNSCDFMICPTHVGGGVNVKLAEAVYNRVPMLTTSFGAKGLPLATDPGIVILDTAEGWTSFLSSDAARQFGSQRVSVAIASQFAMDSHADEFQTFIRTAIERHVRH